MTMTPTTPWSSSTRMTALTSATVTKGDGTAAGVDGAFAVARTLTVLAGSRLGRLVELLDKLHKRSRRRSRLVAMTQADMWLISCPDLGAIFCNRSTQLRQSRES